MATGNYYEQHKGRLPASRPVYPSELIPETEKGFAKQKRRVKKRRSGPARILLGIIKWCLLLCLILCVGAGVIGGIMIHQIVLEAPTLDAMAVAPTQAATYIYDQEGSREQKLTLPEANRDLVTIDHIPLDLQHAFVAIEDARYYTHNGIDLLGIARALWIGLRSRNFSEGASTITQQLLKNSIFTGWTQERTFRERLKRKIQEQYLALKLEKLLSKDQILEDYLNTINLGAGCYGVQAAAYRYFGKDVSELTLSESAVIAGITQNPTRYNPIVNPEENRAKRQIVLSNMLSQGYISRTQMEEALADDVYSRIQSNEERIDVSASIYTFYQDALIDQVMNDLMAEKGYTYKQAYKAVYTGGLKIYSAQDKTVQLICDEEFSNPSNFPASAQVGIDYALSIESADGEITHYGNDSLRDYVRSASDPSFNLMFDSEEAAKSCAEAFKASVLGDEDTLLGERVTVTPQPQASVVVMEQSTGLVRAIVGGRGDKDASLTLNRATYTTRQPGSTFKILTAFAPALNEGGKTLATLYDNGEYFYENGVRVSNWDLDDSSGPATIREAIVRSINVVAVECLTEITPQLGYDYARAMGITTLVDAYDNGTEILTDIIQPLALGGITRGVTNLELCGAYACIANRGKYIQPRFYTQVLDASGEILLDSTTPAEKTVLKESTAYELTDAMRGVITDPTGTAYDEIDLGEMPAAGKTGTTSDYRDIWFAGFTPYYTCCVWGGYDNNEILPEEGDGEISHSYSKVLWNSIMNRLHSNKEAVSFPRPASVVSVAICRETGMAAAPGCPETYEELFETGSAPLFYCNVHGSGQLADLSVNETDASMAGETATVYTSDLSPSGQSLSNQANPGQGQDSFFGSSQGDPNAIVITSQDSAWISYGGDGSQGQSSSGQVSSGQSGTNPAATGQTFSEHSAIGEAGTANQDGGAAPSAPADQGTASVPDIVILN